MHTSRLQYRLVKYFAIVQDTAAKVDAIPAVKTDKLDAIRYFGDRHRVLVIV
jgi:hypothetical protein